MATILKVKSKKTEMIFLESHTTMPVKKLSAKDIFPNIQLSEPSGT